MVSRAVPSDYVVNPGDTLSGIALAFYGTGSELFWRRIHDENRGVIGPDPRAKTAYSGHLSHLARVAIGVRISRPGARSFAAVWTDSAVAGRSEGRRAEHDRGLLHEPIRNVIGITAREQPGCNRLRCCYRS